MKKKKKNRKKNSQIKDLYEVKFDGVFLPVPPIFFPTLPTFL